ncbi:protein translocase subunit SecD [Trebonia sp.]|uniref:protein translocase subunit SecD n=1 Tax=Trebonia sp. TaxID=2767075 RepID=UPI002619A2A7|nr:protein translocase subunit SecD [Trebonia sp.]
MAPPSRSGSRPIPALVALGVIVLIMLFSITGKETFNPAKWHQQFKVGLGLDLSSGTEVVLKAVTSNGQPPSSGEMQQAITVLLARVNGTGNSGAQVQQQGSDLINVTVPGQAEENVINLVSTTAKLSFRPVYLEELYTGPTTSSSSSSAKPKTSSSPSPTPSPTPSATPTASASPTASTTASATPKASTAALSARLASSPSPSASPTASTSASPTASTSASPTASTSASPKASSSPTASTSPKASASPSPSPTASSTSSASAAVTYGDTSLVNAATMKLFNKLSCAPSSDPSNPESVTDAWKSQVGYTLAKAQWTDPTAQIVSCDSDGTKYVLGPAVFEGTDITSVSAGLLADTTQWVVNLTLDGKAQSAFGTLTTNQYDDYYTDAQSEGYPSDPAVLDSTAVVLDGNVVSAPETDAALTSGQFEIQGPTDVGFTQAEATQLTNVLKYGSLPLQFQREDIVSISPQVGHASLDAGLIAAIIGLSLVVIYLFTYYRGLGVVSVSSLLIAASLAYLSVVLLSRYQNFTMSLSAIAGLVVAIGITADSFIVFFERLRDEVREGKTLRPAVESGWRRARRTILVSDTVSFLAAVLLYHFAVSDVQGFAYTLGLTTLIDVLVVFLFTKPMVTLLAGTEFYGGGHRWSGLDPARLGARTPWRSGVRRTVRTQRTAPGARSPARSPASSPDDAPAASSPGASSTGSSTSREA